MAKKGKAKQFASLDEAAASGDFVVTKYAVTFTKEPRAPIGHVLKCWPQQFNDIIDGSKPFTIRKDDRDFAAGDTVVLVEYDPASKQHTGRSTSRVIGYLGRGAPYPDGYCAFMLGYGEACAPDVMLKQVAGRLR